MALVDVLEEGLRPSKRCGPDKVWNPARQRCQDRWTGEPVPPEPTYPEQPMDTTGSFIALLLALTKLGSSLLGTAPTNGGDDSGI